MLLINDVYIFPRRKGGDHNTTTQVYPIIAQAGDMIGNCSIGTHTTRKKLGQIYYRVKKALLVEQSLVTEKISYIGITEESIENSIKGISFF